MLSSAPAHMSHPRQANPIPAGRLRLFRLLTAIGIPLCALGAIEGGLRLAGVGYPTDFFLPDAVEPARLLAYNPAYTRPYFQRGLERRPWPFRLPAQKTRGTYRIFVLGGSAALGDPDPGFGLARQLEVLSASRFPGVRFEVVNAAMTAINSHVVRDIAHACAKRQPDLFVVYMGNNEVVGPFGPGSVLRGYTPSLRLARARVLLQRLRLGQVLRRLRERLTGRDHTRTWRGMAMFRDEQLRATDPRLRVVYDRFEENLREIIRAATGAGAAVAVCTVGTDLRSTPPFASLHRAALAAAERASWQEAFDRGVTAENEGDFTRALAAYADSLALDKTYAATYYRMGRCHEALGAFEEARHHYVKARDLDALRFRADTMINDRIRRCATDPAISARFLDAAAALNRAAPHDIADDSLFMDHVHLTFLGNYVVARSLLNVVADAIEARGLSSPHARGPVLGVKACADACAYTRPDIYRLLRMMYTRFLQAPFTAQMDYPSRIRAMAHRLDALQDYRGPEATRRAQTRYEKALAARPDDWVLHYHFGILLEEMGKPAQALQHCRLAFSRMPYYLPALKYGKALALDGQTGAAARLARGLSDAPTETRAEMLSAWGSLLTARRQFTGAAELFRQALDLNPRLASAYGNLGLLAMREGRPGEAENLFQQALRLQADDPEALANLAMSRLEQGRREEGMRLFREALAAAPDRAALHYNLAVALAAEQNWAEAEKEFRNALALEPDSADALYNLALLYIRQGKIQAARETLTELLRFQPGMAAARYALAGVYRRAGDPAAAERQLDLVANSAADDPVAQEKLGGLYAEIGALQKAETALKECVSRDPTRLDAANNLAWMLATAPRPDLRDGAEAVRIAEELTGKTTPPRATYYDTLAAAYAETGRFNKAARTARKAAELARAAGNDELAAQIAERAAQYDAHAPWRQSPPSLPDTPSP